MVSSSSIKSIRESARTRSVNLTSASHLRSQQLSKLRSTVPISSTTLSSSAPLKGKSYAIDRLTLAEAIQDSTSSSSSDNTSGSSSDDEPTRTGLAACEETEREFTSPVRRGATIVVPLIDLVKAKKSRNPSADFEIIPPIKSIIALDDDEFITPRAGRAAGNKAINGAKAKAAVDEDDEEDWDFLAGSEVMERVASSSSLED